MLVAWQMSRRWNQWRDMVDTSNSSYQLIQTVRGHWQFAHSCSLSRSFLNCINLSFVFMSIKKYKKRNEETITEHHLLCWPIISVCKRYTWADFGAICAVYIPVILFRGSSKEELTSVKGLLNSRTATNSYLKVKHFNNQSKKKFHCFSLDEYTRERVSDQHWWQPR